MKIPILLRLFFTDSSFSMTSWILFQAILNLDLFPSIFSSLRLTYVGEGCHIKFGYPSHGPVDFLPRSVLLTIEKKLI
ncbi:hypothetical protein HanRHA438_Chr16g0742431 [Helianthus annuus]|nr:hypothetical protein HanRHA438_Chr16g0742431 [Helianthus annuus]